MVQLNEEQIGLIYYCVNKDKYDISKMISYVETHEIIEQDIFKKIRKNKKSSIGEGTWHLEKGYSFEPISVESFINRIPFYFYEADREKHLPGALALYARRSEEEFDSLEDFYKGLEYLYYEQGLALDEIFNYPIDQVNTPSTKSGLAALAESMVHKQTLSSSVNPIMIMKEWIHYLQLCNELKWKDKKPNRFITRYNEALEASGLEPIIYYADRYYYEWFFRQGNVYQCYGHFPCDEEGKPILKWIGIKIKNAKSITFDAEKSRQGVLSIEITPKSSIHAICIWILREHEEDVFSELFENIDETSNENEWIQIYEGPLNMQFSYRALKEIRLRKGMTQVEVANAIGASVRTYQKWEGGETTPDGHYLLRIMNWLEITDVQELITYTDCKEVEE